MLSSGNILQWAVVTLLGLAVLMVNSAGLMVGRGDLSIQSILFGRPTLYALLAVAVMMFTSSLDLRKLFAARGLANPVLWLLLLALGLCVAVLIPGIGIEINHSRRWMQIVPGQRFQPSELAKWVMVLVMAWWGARTCGGIRYFFSGFLPAVLLTAIICILVGIEDFGTSALIGGVAVMILLAAGAKIWHLLLLAGPGLVGVVAMIAMSPYRMKRITAFLDPLNDPSGAGYHLIQSKAAFWSGGLTGRGFGNGVSKFGYLPEDTTDFIFAIVGEELGLAGVALVICMYVVLLWVGFGIVRECRHQFARLLCFGVLLTVAFQAVMNMGVVTGLLPTKGIALPLLSNGGTGWILTSAAIGLVAAADRLNRLEAAGELEPLDLSSPRLVPPTPGLSVSASTCATPNG